MRDSETDPTEREHPGTATSETDGTATSETNGSATLETDGSATSETDGTAASGTDGNSSTDDDREVPVPTQQPAELRRQQLVVGTAGAVLVALAVVVSLFQQFPTLPLPVILLAGLLGGIGTAWLVSHSVFPGEGEPPEE